MNLLLHLLVLLAINSLLVAALGLVVGVGGVVALNAGAMTMIGAYAYGIATTHFALSPFVAFTLACVIGLLLGWPLSRGLTRFASEDLVLATLAGQLVITSIVANVDALTGVIYGLPNIQRLSLGQPSLEAVAVPTLLLAVVGIALVARLYRGPFARALRGSRDAPLDTTLLGRSIPTIQARAFISAAVASAAGGALLASYLTYIDPTTGDIGVSVSILAAVILGGAGRVGAALVGAAIITLLPEALRFIPITTASSPAIQQATFGAILVLCMLRRPQGLFGEYRFQKDL